MGNTVSVSVDLASTPKNCTPDPVVMKKDEDDTAIKWTCKDDNYTFTGVTIDSTTYTPGSPGSGEFNSLTISTNGSKSVMEINDSITDYNNHKYTLNYTDPSGNAGSFDPTIRNARN